jgi:hypothetical protein
MRALLFPLFIAAMVWLPAVATAEPRIDPPPTADEFEEHLPAGGTLDGRELYDRFLKNRKRLRTVYQEGRILSRDPGGNPQETNFWLQSKDYRDENDKAVDEVFAKVLLKLTGPREMRHTAYLYVHKDAPQDDQFMYSPNRRRTSRVILKNQTIAGTDFSFDDFIITIDDIEDADYKRHADTVVQDVSCYVVEAFLKPTTRTQYSRSLSYLEKDHYVPLKTRYWDKAGVAVKELTSTRDSIKVFDGAWIPTRSTMVDLLEDTRSDLVVDTLVPNPDLDESDLAIGILEVGP